MQRVHVTYLGKFNIDKSRIVLDTPTQISRQSLNKWMLLMVLETKPTIGTPSQVPHAYTF